MKHIGHFLLHGYLLLLKNCAINFVLITNTIQKQLTRLFQTTQPVTHLIPSEKGHFILQLNQEISLAYLVSDCQESGTEHVLSAVFLLINWRHD